MMYQKNSFKVADYANWSKIYKEVSQIRKKYSCKGTKVYTEKGNKNNVTIILHWPDKGSLEKYRDSNDIKEAMKKAGVISAPDVKLSEKNDFDLGKLDFQFETDV